MQVSTKETAAKLSFSETRLRHTWSKKMGFSFNTMTAGQMFSDNTTNLVFGTVKGKVRVFKDHKEEFVLETKGGAVQAVALYDVTKFGSVDVVVGDVDGNVVVFSNGQIFRRRSVNSPVTALAIQLDTAQNFSLAVGDFGGGLTTFDAGMDVVFRLQLGEETIRCMLPVQMRDAYGLMTHMLLVSDGSSELHFFAKDICVKRLPVSSPVLAMCAGTFYLKNEGEEQDNTTSKQRQHLKSEHTESRKMAQHPPQQVLLGCEDGWIYLLHENLEVERFIHVGYCITSLTALPPSFSSSSSFSTSSVMNTTNNKMENGSASPCTTHVMRILCGGHFAGLRLYENEQLVGQMETSEWVHSVCVMPLSDNEQQPQKSNNTEQEQNEQQIKSNGLQSVVVACVDDTIYHYQL
ncbi:hypothetical protein QOT17_015103 [Balamuthia mandrillaris]